MTNGHFQHRLTSISVQLVLHLLRIRKRRRVEPRSEWIYVDENDRHRSRFNRCSVNPSL